MDCNLTKSRSTFSTPSLLSSGNPEKKSRKILMLQFFFLLFYKLPHLWYIMSQQIGCILMKEYYLKMSYRSVTAKTNFQQKYIYTCIHCENLKKLQQVLRQLILLIKWKLLSISCLLSAPYLEQPDHLWSTSGLY